jgi:transcriptional regulator with XRE-family HTH domain
MKVFCSATFIQLRRSKKLSQQDIADHLDIHQTTVHHWEAGKSGCLPDINQLQYLAELFETTLDSFFNNSASNYPPPKTK